VTAPFRIDDSHAGLHAWIDLFGQVARHYRIPLPEQRARLAGLWHGTAD